MDPGYIEGNAEEREAKQLRRPSLPKAKQWLQFLEHHQERMPLDGIGWLALARDAVVELHLLAAVAARRLRGNPGWDMQGTMTQDTEKLEYQARKLLTKVEAINKKDVPARLEFLFDSLIGAVKNQIRLSREIDKMKAEGELVVDVTIDRPARQLVEEG